MLRAIIVMLVAVVAMLVFLLVMAVSDLHAADGSYEGEIAPGVRLVLRHKIHVQSECTLLGRIAEHPVIARGIESEWWNPRQMLLFKRIETMSDCDWVLGGIYLEQGETIRLAPGTRFVLEYDDHEVRCSGVLMTDELAQTVVYDLNERAIVVDPEGPFLTSRSGAVLIYLWFEGGSLSGSGSWSYEEPSGVRLENGGGYDVHASTEVP